MRAAEFIVEYKTEEYRGLRFTTDIKNGQLIVRALDDWGVNELGRVVFNIGDNDELDPQDLEVDSRYQRQGVASTMYDYVKTLGYEIHRSYDQTPAGAGFWNKHRGEDVRVWEQTLAEIEAIPGWQYSGGKESLQDYNNINPSLLKPLPGNSGFAYAIDQGHIMTSIFIVDPNKNPTDAIAVLELEKSYLPLKGNPLTVETITVDEDYQGRGLAKALYGIVLTIMKRPLMAGSAQTPGGRRNWLSLVNTPGVEVKGVIQLDNRRLDTANAVPGSKHEKYIEQTMDQVMELGGQFISKDKYSTYWAFDVVPGKGQLQPYIKNSLSKIYGDDVPTTLMAYWGGK